MPETHEISVRPEISVVVPSYRRPELLNRLVAALEAQSLARHRFEVLIVDNGSGDSTTEVLADLAGSTPLSLRPMSVVENHGPARARNLGWRHARAPIVAFIDDDCVPDAEWLEQGLEAMAGDPAVGVLQGTTLPPDGATYSDWTIYREVTGPSPYFEACNVVYRKQALEAVGGFDEEIGYYGEDTALGWAVLEAGWARSFCAAAVVYHDVEDRDLKWHIKAGYKEGNLVGLAERFPEFARAAFWRPWAARDRNAAFPLALIGLALTPVFPAAVLAVKPYFDIRQPPADHPRLVRLVLERAVVDLAILVGTQVAAIKHRRFLL
ncbi:MAG: glycosyltransferase family 2 protein [Acidimicrobiales bacterium]